MTFSTFFFSSTVFSEDNVEIKPNGSDNNLFDASIAVTIEEDDIAPHDVMTCDVRLAEGAFEERFDKSILKEKGRYKKD